MNRREFTANITQLVQEMVARGDQPVFDYILRSAEEQQRLWAKGRRQALDGQWYIENPAKVVTYCDGIASRSAHQLGRAADIYLVRFNPATGRYDFSWDPDKAEFWHKRWEELGGKPMIKSDTFVDYPHFEG